MSEETTTSQMITHPYQILVETTEGTTPGSGTFTIVDTIMQSLSIKKDGQFVDITQLGPEDLIAITQGPKVPETQVRFAMSDTTFLERIMNAANPGTPSGTVSETFSALIGFYLNGTINYVVMKGSRPKTGTVTMEVGKETIVTAEFTHTSIAKPTTSAPAGTTVTTTFSSAAPLTWLSGGADPVSHNSNAQNCTKVSVTVNRNAKHTHTLGNTAPYGTKTHARRINGDMEILHTNTTLETDHDAGTARTITVALSGSKTLTLTSAVLTNMVYDDEAESDVDKVEKATFRAPSVAIA